MGDAKIDLAAIPVHLGLGAKITVQEPFTGDMAWYERYGERNATDGVEGRLVMIYTFAEPWTTWEVHPQGHELVLCLAGRITLHQEIDGQSRSVTLEPHEAVINAPGVWHTADVDREATALFITAGTGTQHRPRT
jgi:hypothetical protein